MRRLRAGAGLVTLTATVILALASTANAQSATSITGVVFHGSATAPEVVVNGHEFGSAPPKAGKPGCHASGSTYGAVGGKSSFGLINDTGNWVAGASKACIGIVITSWTETQVVFHFGNNYEFYKNLNPGYNFVVQVKQAFFGGTVSYT
jgi:hypothetical protein